jgi:hypothetical protein
MASFIFLPNMLPRLASASYANISPFLMLLYLASYGIYASIDETFKNFLHDRHSQSFLSLTEPCSVDVFKDQWHRLAYAALPII